MNIIIVQFLLLFIISICIIEIVLYVRRARYLNRSELRSKIKKFSLAESGSEAPDILRKRTLSDVAIINTILTHIPGLQRLDRLKEQANLHYPLGFFILLALFLLLMGFYSSFLLAGNYSIALIVAAVLGSIPFLYLNAKKKKRMEKFEAQLPEGLEFIARALRAGHAFTGSMKLAAENFEDPLGTEFERTLDEINFGISTTDALKNLLNRVDSHDLRYFVVSAILQRETGGNLAEIMESIARIIRERFKFKDKVRVLSAEGKLSGVILICIPLFVIAYLQIVSPLYLLTLITEPVGRILAITAASMMFIGVLLMKRIITINV
jgi:tight adherence protein B